MSRPRRLALFGILAVTIAAVMWIGQTDEDADPSHQVVAANPRTARPTEVPARLPLARLTRVSMAEPETDVFAAPRQVLPPPPPSPVVALPPAPPAAPPLPFSFAGTVAEDGKITYYLVRGDDTFAVHPGDALGAEYRFDGIDHGQLLLRYLPLDIVQPLPLPASEG